MDSIEQGKYSIHDEKTSGGTIVKWILIRLLSNRISSLKPWFSDSKFCDIKELDFLTLHFLNFDFLAQYILIFDYLNSNFLNFDYLTPDFLNFDFLIPTFLNFDFLAPNFFDFWPLTT